MATQPNRPSAPHATTRANNPTKNNPNSGIPRKGGTPPARQTHPVSTATATGKKTKGEKAESQ